jgi:DNA-directed RNA polymerase subunit RPC12/RpoP
MTEYFCCGYQEGCGFICSHCDKENWWVHNDSFMQAEDNEYDEHKCQYCGKTNIVTQCKGCN